MGWEEGRKEGRKVNDNLYKKLYLSGFMWGFIESCEGCGEVCVGLWDFVKVDVRVSRIM